MEDKFIIGQRGGLTLPAELRKSYGLKSIV